LNFTDINIHQFSIGDISSLGEEYQRGGIAREVKQPVKINFVSLIFFRFEKIFIL
jgi:hypothetical protein